MSTARSKRLEALAALAGMQIPDEVVEAAGRENPWFTEEMVRMAWKGISEHLLEAEALDRWLSAYPEIENHTLSLGLVLAGNLPMVGFHDLLCGYLAGWQLKIKGSSKDRVLMQWVIESLKHADHESTARLEWVDKLHDCQAVIATGSNNTNRYFEYYFRHVPHILRGSRNSVAVLTGNETSSQLQALGKDIFSYFGFGCRNVSLLLLPAGYDTASLFPHWKDFEWLHRHTKYMNNYDYQRTSLLLSHTPHLANEFSAIVENPSPASPISVIHAWFVKDLEESLRFIEENRQKIQAVVADPALVNKAVPFGMSQFPGPDVYADGIDTMQFLTEQALLMG